MIRQTIEWQENRTPERKQIGFGIARRNLLDKRIIQFSGHFVRRLTASQNSNEIMNNTQTLIATLEGAPDIIIGLVREVPSQNLKRRPSPNKWSAHEHACHIGLLITSISRYAGNEVENHA